MPSSSTHPDRSRRAPCPRAVMLGREPGRRAESKLTGRLPSFPRDYHPPVTANKDTYDVCLSFAGEQRQYVERVAERLREQVSVFYDEYETVALWGRNLYEHLDEVYRERARYCVVFISEDYARKVWTNHERQSAQARALMENREYILPVRFDDSEIPGILPTIGYVDLRQRTPGQLADLILEKIGASPKNSRLSSVTPVDVLSTTHRPTLISQRPSGWEYMLFGSHLEEGQTKLAPKQRDHFLRYARRTDEIVNLDEVTAHVSRAIGEARFICADLMKVFTPEAQEWAFGSPGEAGDPENIAHLASIFTKAHEDLLDWAARLRGTTVPPEIAKAVEFSARLVDDPIRQISDFVVAACAQMRQIPSLLADRNEDDPPIELFSELVLTVSDDVVENIDAELDQVIKNLRPR